MYSLSSYTTVIRFSSSVCIGAKKETYRVHVNSPQKAASLCELLTIVTSTFLYSFLTTLGKEDAKYINVVIKPAMMVVISKIINALPALSCAS